MKLYKIPAQTDISSREEFLPYEYDTSESHFDSKFNYVMFADDILSLGFKKTVFSFHGTGNIVYCGPSCSFHKSSINLHGDNNVIFFEGGGKGWPLYLQISLGYDSLFFLGSNHFISEHGPRLKVIQGERRNVLIGRDTLISNNVTIRTSDAHAVYSLNDDTRINEAKDVVIGEHVWLCENAMVLKGSVLESGCILAADAICSGKRVDSNCIAAGNPAHAIKDGIFWEKPGVNFKDADTLEKRQKAKKTSHFDFRKQPIPQWYEQILSVEHSLPALDRYHIVLDALK